MKIKTVVACSIVLLLMAAAVYYLIYVLKGKALKQNPDKRYNVVMIVSDAMRQDIPGCYGGEALTPNIDWLAGNGVLFENAYSTSPWTAPSAVSMFTGNYATSYGYSPANQTMRIYVPDSEFLLFEAMRQTGYDTSVKSENPQATMHNNIQGLVPLARVGAYDAAFDRVVPKQIRKRIQKITGSAFYRSSAYKNSFIFLDYLLDIPPEENFFMLHWIIDPHEPYQPIDKFLSRIDVDPPTLRKPKRFYSTRKSFPEGMSNAEEEFVRNLYIAEAESVDERIGFVLDILRYKKLLDTTYIIFTSDHGEQFGEHDQYGHGGFGRECNYYEVLLRVPLIISGPELPKGKRIKAKFILLELMPTLKELLGFEYKDKMQGKSQKSLLFGDSKARESLYFDDVREHDQVDALIENNFKLISSEGNEFELYDLTKDKHEQTNVASDYPDLVEAMFEKIVEMRKLNKQMQVKNVAALEDNRKQLSNKEKQELLKSLKALGYID